MLPGINKGQFSALAHSTDRTKSKYSNPRPRRGSRLKTISLRFSFLSGLNISSGWLLLTSNFIITLMKNTVYGLYTLKQLTKIL